MKPFLTLLASVVLGTVSCTNTPEYTHVYTTEQTRWAKADKSSQNTDFETITLNINPSSEGQTVDGFGACFNELGWTSLSRLTEEERAAIFSELFLPGEGASFNICRMPVAANDFALDWYSYNETEGDFEMKNFSIDNDKKTLIPFIKSAKKYNPELRIWASPWAPPSWMKHNKHYASQYTDENTAPQYRNGLAKDKQGYEGTDMFICKPEYMKAYALYFSKFIESYRNEGIDIFGVMPQNEFNSAQIFPSCCWTAASLSDFIGNYLGPELSKQNVEVMFGTMERANNKLVDTILNHPESGKYINTVGFQWAGKGAIAAIHKEHPELKLYQTEQECGDGRNSWQGTVYSWELMKHYFDNGASAYMYWNISLDEGGISRWGWAQNSLVVVDPATNKYRFSSEYYLIKHISHYVKPGAKYIKTDGNTETLVFKNPDGTVVVLTMEKEGKEKNIQINIDGKTVNAVIPANSINTICL